MVGKVSRVLINYIKLGITPTNDDAPRVLFIGFKVGTSMADIVAKQSLTRLDRYVLQAGAGWHAGFGLPAAGKILFPGHHGKMAHCDAHVDVLQADLAQDPVVDLVFS